MRAAHRRQRLVALRAKRFTPLLVVPALWGTAHLIGMMGARFTSAAWWDFVLFVSRQLLDARMHEKKEKHTPRLSCEDSGSSVGGDDEREYTSTTSRGSLDLAHA